MSEKTVSIEKLDSLVEAKLETIAERVVAKLAGKDDTGAKEMPLKEARGSSIVRDRKFEIKPEQKGIAAARQIRALAFGRGDPDRAKVFVDKVYNDDLGDEIKKALTATELTGGGSLIIPEYAAEVIELLRSRTVVRAAGARVLPMDAGTLTIRKQTSGSSASYVGESQDIGVTQPETGQINLVSKKLAAIVPISNDLIKFSSSPSADEFVRDDLVMELSIREDRAFLRDDGLQNTPKGIRHWAANAIPTEGTTATDIEEDFRNLLNALETKDVRMLRPAWFMNPRSRNHLRNLRDANGNLIYPEIRATSPTMYGFPVFSSTSIPINLGSGSNETEVYLVDMVDAIIGEASSLEVSVDAAASYIENASLQSAFSRDETLIRAIMRHDFAMRHAESAAVTTGVTWGA